MSVAPIQVSSYTKWGPPEEVIVSRALNARIAQPDLCLFAVGIHLARLLLDN